MIRTLEEYIRSGRKDRVYFETSNFLNEGIRDKVLCYFYRLDEENWPSNDELNNLGASISVYPASDRFGKNEQKKPIKILLREHRHESTEISEETSGLVRRAIG